MIRFCSCVLILQISNNIIKNYFNFQVMGLTFVAAGVSIPDALSSMAVIKEGYGDMAVSNAVGSNVFDILICLGLPWLIQTTIIDAGGHVNVISKGLYPKSILQNEKLALAHKKKLFSVFFSIRFNLFDTFTVINCGIFAAISSFKWLET